jgi:hypothetical protein
VWAAWAARWTGLSSNASSPGPQILLSALVEEFRLAEDAHDCSSVVCRDGLLIVAIVVRAGSACLRACRCAAR